MVNSSRTRAERKKSGVAQSTGDDADDDDFAERHAAQPARLAGAI
jgi:hypothetical protein